MPRRKQSNPQPVKLECEAGAVVCDPGCLVLESDFLLSEELEFGDAEIMGLDRDSGMAVFSLSVEDDPAAPEHSAFPAFLSCRGCGQLLGDTPLGAGLAIGEGLDLGAGLYCLACEEGVQSESHTAQETSQEEEESSSAGQSSGGRATRRRRGKAGGRGGAAASKLYSCSLCSFSSRYSNHLKRHMRTHDGEKPYRCAVCPYASAQRVNLQRHARTHTGEKPYRCPHCSYACSSLGNLRRHQRMHAQDSRAAPTRDKRRPRRRRRHGTERGDEAVLSDLTVRVSDGGSFLQSLNLASPTAPLPELLFPLVCRACGRSLEGDEAAAAEGEGGEVCCRCSAELLAKNPASCSPEPAGPRRRRPAATKLYRCPSCPFLSHYPNHLARHAHTHSGQKPHLCPDCPFASAHLDNLKRHRRVHTGEKPYQCPSCSYACGNLANLRRHERVHSGAKPFRCAVCGYSCNQSVNLKRHMLRHTGEKPYGCAECGYTTGHWDNYKRHQRKHGHNTDSWDKHDGHSWVTGTHADAHGQGDGDM